MFSSSRWATVPEQTGSKSGVAAVPLSVQGESDTASHRLRPIPLYLRPAVCMATIDMGRKWEGAAVPLCLGELGPI